jgi:hypothetical protein
MATTPDPGQRMEVIRFDLADAHEQIADFGARFPAARACTRGRSFVDAATGARLLIPFVLPPLQPGEAPPDYAARMPEHLGRICLLLLQAGASAMGYWDGAELVRHKAEKRYVVRGNGKAQPTHRKTRGKSRYGSRLRLLNWKRLLAGANRRLGLWWSELGEPEQFFVSVPIRSMSDLFAADPAPPIARDDARVRRVPVHAHIPDFRELQRVHRLLLRGRLELPKS